MKAKNFKQLLSEINDEFKVYVNHEGEVLEVSNFELNLVNESLVIYPNPH